MHYHFACLLRGIKLHKKVLQNFKISEEDARSVEEVQDL
jgi:hypothetical protein